MSEVDVNYIEMDDCMPPPEGEAAALTLEEMESKVWASERAVFYVDVDCSDAEIEQTIESVRKHISSR